MGQNFDSFWCVVMAVRFFVERNNAPFTHHSKTCELWPLWAQLGHTWEEKVLASISDQERAEIPCKCHTQEGGRVRQGAGTSKCRLDNRTCKLHELASRHSDKHVPEKLAGSSRAKKSPNRLGPHAQENRKSSTSLIWRHLKYVQLIFFFLLFFLFYLLFIKGSEKQNTQMKKRTNEKVSRVKVQGSAGRLTEDKRNLGCTLPHSAWYMAMYLHCTKGQSQSTSYTFCNRLKKPLENSQGVTTTQSLNRRVDYLERQNFYPWKRNKPFYRYKYWMQAQRKSLDGKLGLLQSRKQSLYRCLRSPLIYMLIRESCFSITTVKIVTAFFINSSL